MIHNMYLFVSSVISNYSSLFSWSKRFLCNGKGAYLEIKYVGGHSGVGGGQKFTLDYRSVNV